MAYIDIKYNLMDRLHSVLHEIKVTKRLGTQLCMLYELLLIRVYELESFRKTHNVTRPEGIDVPVEELNCYFEELGVSTEIVPLLEQFRNAYVHCGGTIAGMYYRALVKQGKVIELVLLAEKLDVTLDFTLDL